MPFQTLQFQRQYNYDLPVQRHLYETKGNVITPILWIQLQLGNFYNEKHKKVP